MKYRVIRAGNASGTCTEGDTVYTGLIDYGLADDDTRYTGIKHVSVTLTEGLYPTFTIPLADLEPL